MGKKRDTRILAEAERIYKVLLELGERLPEGIDPKELKELIEKAKATTLAVDEMELKLKEATLQEQRSVAEAVETLVGMASGAVPPAPSTPDYEYIDVTDEIKRGWMPSA